MCDPSYKSQVPTVWQTSTSYGGTLSSALAKTGTGIDNYTWASPYSPGSFIPGPDPLSAQNLGRLNSLTVRFRYTGRGDAMGGTVYGIVHPSQISLVGVPMLNLANYRGARVYPVSNRWQYLTVAPQHAEDLQWTSLDCPWTSTDAATSAPFVALVFATADIASFQVEAIAHCESSGTDSSALGTVSHIGDQSVLDAVNSAGASINDVPDSSSSIWADMTNRLSNIADSPALRAAARFGASLAQAYARGAGAMDPVIHGRMIEL